MVRTNRKILTSFDIVKKHCIDELHKAGVTTFNGKNLQQLKLSELKTKLAVVRAQSE